MSSNMCSTRLHAARVASYILGQRGVFRSSTSKDAWSYMVTRQLAFGVAPGIPRSWGMAII